MTKPLLFKVLSNGHACHGGDFKYSLPKNGKPGDWHETDKAHLRNCGFHVVPETRLHDWYELNRDHQVYVAEVGGSIHKSSDKWAATKIRLLREATKEEIRSEGFLVGEFVPFDADDLEEVNVLNGTGYISSNTITTIKVRGDDGHLHIDGCADVQIGGKSILNIGDRVSVTVYDNCTLKAENDSRVLIYNAVSPIVVATDGSLVEILGIATKEQLNNIYLYDGAILKYKTKKGQKVIFHVCVAQDRIVLESAEEPDDVESFFESLIEDEDELFNED